MKPLLLLLILTFTSFTFAQTNALVCEQNGEISKAEIFKISQLKYENMIAFDDTLTQEEILRQITQRIEKNSVLLGEMFANIYTVVASDTNINLENFLYANPAQTQLYRICDDANNLPKLTTIAKQEATLKVDEHILNKLSPLNQEAIVLNEIIKRLNISKVKKEDYFRGTYYVDQPI